MRKRILIIVIAGLLPFYLFIHCNSGASSNDNSISSDTGTIADGEAIFNQSCSGCHNFRQDGIGPQLGGLTTKVSAKWIHDFIKNPQELISSGNERAVELFNKYKVVMPSFATLKHNDVDAIIAFLHTHKFSGQQITKDNGAEVSNPVPESIELSDFVIDLKLVTQVPPSSHTGKLPLARITKLDFQQNSDALFILDLRGTLYKLDGKEILAYMDMAKLKTKFINQPGLATGFGSFTFHPEFAKNGLLYTTHTEAPGSGKPDFSYVDSIKVTVQWVVTEWKTANPGDNKFSGTSRELLRVNMVTGGHGVQEITFNPLSEPGMEDYGLLYIGVGDGGSVEQGYPFLTHSIDRIWGTILRIDPMGRNSRNGQYGIPLNNPFNAVSNNNTVREIYSYGFRNPHRITWTKSGKMIACNIGQKNIESINLILPGHDYGWPVREGSFVIDPHGNMNKIYPLPSNDSNYKITYPVAFYDHDEGKAISGGFEYWGTSIPQLKGKYIFGDIPTGRLFYVNIADLKLGKLAPIKEWKISTTGSPRTFKELHPAGRVDLHFGRDSQGELYILTKIDGKVYMLEKATMKN